MAGESGVCEGAQGRSAGGGGELPAAPPRARGWSSDCRSFGGPPRASAPHAQWPAAWPRRSQTARPTILPESKIPNAPKYFQRRKVWGGERPPKARPCELACPLTKSLNSLAGWVTGEFLVSMYLPVCVCVFEGEGVFVALNRPPQFPGNPPRNPITHPPCRGTPSSRGRVKLHCLRPLPPPDPAPARPLPGFGRGRGGLGTDPEARLFTSTPEAPAPVAVPLLPPTAAWENSCLPLHTGVGLRFAGAASFSPQEPTFQAFRAWGLPGKRRRGTPRGP